MSDSTDPRPPDDFLALDGPDVPEPDEVLDDTVDPAAGSVA